MIESVARFIAQTIVSYRGPFREIDPIRRYPYEGMVPVPAGTFEMGSHWHSGYPDELPVHTVYLDAFYIDVCEVNNEKYAAYLNTAYQQGRVTVDPYGAVFQVGGAGRALCDTGGHSGITWNGLRFGVKTGRGKHPMVMVNWFGACAYANHLSRKSGLTPCYDETSWSCDFGANGYRLPTEAEWEYAARGGEHSPYYYYPWGDAIDGSKANYWNSGDPYEGTYPTNQETTPVGYYDGNQSPSGVDMANGYGLYDTSGNVYEWCWDRYGSTYYSTSPYDNPTGPSSGQDRVNRGGCWLSDHSNFLRSAHRNSADPGALDWCLGFRVVAARR